MDVIMKKETKSIPSYFNATWHQRAAGTWQKRNVKQTGQKEGKDTEQSDTLQKKRQKNTTEMCENHRMGKI